MKRVGRTSSQSYQTSIIPCEVDSQPWGGLWSVDVAFMVDADAQSSL